MKKRIKFGIIVCLAMIMLWAAAACADEAVFKDKKDVLGYISANQPMELTLEGVRMKPLDLLEIKDALPEGAVFHFKSQWGSIELTDDMEEADLTSKPVGNIKVLRAILQLCPNIRVLDNAASLQISNKDMIALIEEYPDVRFEWVVNLGKGYRVSTKSTAYSTFKRIGVGGALTSKDLELLKYCPRLKALDLGHHRITSLAFLRYVPDLELLILADNNIKDITPIGELKHLQYAELFKNPIADLTPLAGCHELLDLNLTATSITDLSALDNVKLERLWVNSCKSLPGNAVDHFKQEHPGCEALYKPSHAATVDGWRDHPRYKHYIRCLKSKKWISFGEE